MDRTFSPLLDNSVLLRTYKYAVMQVPVDVNFIKMLGEEETLHESSSVVVLNSAGEDVTNCVLVESSVLEDETTLRAVLKDGDPGYEYEVRFIGIVDNDNIYASPGPNKYEARVLLRILVT